MTAERGFTHDQWIQMEADAITKESHFQRIVIADARRHGYLIYHTEYSRGSAPGYPDLHLVNARTRTSLFRELKTQKGKVSPAQQEWLTALAAAGLDAGVWRPIDWFNGTITRQLDS